MCVGDGAEGISVNLYNILLAVWVTGVASFLAVCVIEAKRQMQLGNMLTYLRVAIDINRVQNLYYMYLATYGRLTITEMTVKFLQV